MMQSMRSPILTCTFYNVELYTVQCTVYNVQYTLYSVQCTPYIISYQLLDNSVFTLCIPVTYPYI